MPDEFLTHAVSLARAAEANGNAPIGAVLVLDGEVVAEGRNAIQQPRYDPTRHAEVEAVRALAPALWARAGAITCYTTLEPCLMCAGTLLLCGVRRVVFGAADPAGGAGPVVDRLPPYYPPGWLAWEGPRWPEVCDPLYARARRLFDDLPCGRPGP